MRREIRSSSSGVPTLMLGSLPLIAAITSLSLNRPSRGVTQTESSVGAATRRPGPRRASSDPQPAPNLLANAASGDVPPPRKSIIALSMCMPLSWRQQQNVHYPRDRMFR